MGRLIEHEPGSIVEMNGHRYVVVSAAEPRHMCCVCALAMRYEECKLVQCSSAFRKDRTRVYYREEGGEK